MMMATLKPKIIQQGIFIILLVVVIQQISISQAALPGLQTTTYDGKF